MATFRFEVQAYKKVDVSGFSDVDEARTWLVDHLEQEMRDVAQSAYVSNGEVVKEEGE